MTISLRALILMVAIGLFAMADPVTPLEPDPGLERGKCVENCN